MAIVLTREKSKAIWYFSYFGFSM